MKQYQVSIRLSLIMWIQLGGRKRSSFLQLVDDISVIEQVASRNDITR